MDETDVGNLSSYCSHYLRTRRSLRTVSTVFRPWTTRPRVCRSTESIASFLPEERARGSDRKRNWNWRSSWNSTERRIVPPESCTPRWTGRPEICWWTWVPWDLPRTVRWCGFSNSRKTVHDIATEDCLQKRLRENPVVDDEGVLRCLWNHVNMRIQYCCRRCFYENMKICPSYKRSSSLMRLRIVKSRLR